MTLQHFYYDATRLSTTYSSIIIDKQTHSQLVLDQWLFEMNNSTFRNKALLKARKLCDRGKAPNAVEQVMTRLKVLFEQREIEPVSDTWFEVAVLVCMLDVRSNREHSDRIQSFLTQIVPGYHAPVHDTDLWEDPLGEMSETLEQIEALYDRVLHLEREQADEAELREFVEVDFLGTVQARQIPYHLVENGRSLQMQDQYDRATGEDGLCFECPVQCCGPNKGVLFSKVFNLIGHITRLHAPPTAEYADLKPVRILAVNVDKKQYRLNLPGGRWLDWRLVQKAPGSYTEF